MKPFVRAGAFAAALLVSSLPIQAQDEPWRPIGLMRIRDMTPFGIVRLDMLPAHAVPATPGTFAFETNVTYQNTYVLSKNVQDYLASRGRGRSPLTQEDVEAILAMPESYLVDGEFGLADLTLHYRFSEHVGLYATLPYYYFDGGYLDHTIEDFHESVGLSAASRDQLPRNRFQLAGRLGETTVFSFEEPENGFGDPVFGLRYSLFTGPRTWNLLVEGAAKVAFQGEKFLVSSGRSDYGAQVTLQRFFSRRALYLSLAGVYFTEFDPKFPQEEFIPTLIAGYEFRITKRTNGILQFYASPSVVQDSMLEELTDDKYQLTLGLQSRRRNTVYRFGITENISNFDNTPDIGITLSVAQILPGRR